MTATQMAETVALFAGPGGACLGIREATGSDPIGLEYDADAVATRRAAGLASVQVDLSTYPTAWPSVDGLWGSPPCPAFSDAGSRGGAEDLPLLCGYALGDPEPVWGHPDSALVARAMDWIRGSRPRWVVLEQVRAIAPVWASLVVGLERIGYSAWSGVLNSADYGVPQTRRRAFLLASLSRPVSPPEPTHARDPEPSLWGEALPWVSMAEALGWDGDGSVLNTGRDWKKGGTREDAQKVPGSAPAPTVTGQAGPQWFYSRPATTIMGDPRVWPPGHKINQGDRDRLGAAEAAERCGDRAGTEAIKLQPFELGLLQGFPADHPWQGSRTSQAQQIGNAVPPPMAAALVRAVA